MPTMDLKIPAATVGGEETDGMPLAELEATLAAIRQAGGKDSTRLKVDTNRHGRVKAVTGQIRAEDSDLTVAHDAINGPRAIGDNPQA